MSKQTLSLADLDCRKIFDANLDAFFILDNSGRILDANQTAVNRYGYSMQELKLMHASDLASPELKKHIPAKLHDLLLSGEIFEWKHRCKDGKEIPVEIYSHPLAYLDKNAILSCARDISKRQNLSLELENKKHMLERILDTEPGTVYIFDLAENKNVYINRHWLEAFGYSVEETQALGAELYRIFHPNDLAFISAHHTAWRDASEGERRSVEYRIRDKKGSWHWLLSVETPFNRDENGRVCQILGIAYDISVRKNQEVMLAEAKLKHIHMLESMTDAFVELDGNWCYTYLNKKAAELFGRTQESLLGKHIWTEFPEGVGQPFHLHYIEASNEQKPVIFEEYYVPWDRWYENRVFPSQHGLIILFQDITVRKRAQTLLSGQNKILEMIASGAHLPDTLTELILLIESQSPGVLCSILLLDEDGIHVLHGAAPNLPDDYIQAINGLPIGPAAGSCGTAAYRKEAVYVEDIASDPLWLTYKTAALAHGLRACWSTPIFSTSNQVLGTFAIYSKQIGLPTDAHLHLIETATHLAAIAINKHQTENALRQSEETLRLFIHYSPSAIAMFDNEMRYLAYSKRWLTDYSLDKQNLLGRSHYEIFPDLPEHWKAVHQNTLAGATEKADEDKFTRADGSVDWVHWETHPWLTSIGEIGGIIIFSEVVTKRKMMQIQAERLTQLYAALSQCNQAIVRSSNEAELFPQICRDAVTFGGMKMAWIGMIDEKNNLIRPASSFGEGINYLQSLEISLSADKPTSKGPTGISISQQVPVWCQDFQHDPITSSWHQQGREFGWGSSAALPLYCKGSVVGVFSLYSGIINAFDDPIKNLLIEMSLDISFALDNFANIADHRQSVIDLRNSEQHLRTIIETEPECVKILDKNGKLLEMNTAGLDMLELGTMDEAKKHNLLEFVLPQYRDAFANLHQRVMQGQSGTLEFEIKGMKGAMRWLETHAAPMRDENGKIISLLGITRDISQRKLSEERIQYLANFDILTGLPNRSQLDDHLKYALKLAKRSNGRLTVMFIDIDRFKDINDSLGHSYGDAFLIEVSKRLKSVLREEDTASRLGGDEFILMLPGTDSLGAANVAQKLLQAIAEPFRNEQYDISATASIGIALYPEDGINMESLSKSADTAMYRAKHEGRNGYRFFTSEMQERATRNLQLVNALRHALERNELQVHYQPQVSIANGQIIGAEALIRWQHPELGNVSPGEFIPVAEDSGLILPLGEWVLRTAAQQIKQWISIGYPPIVIAVNLSAVQFRHASLLDMVTRILNEAKLPAKYLELELTEGVAMHDPLGAITVMNNLHDLGVNMSIDDFGTGYSSLNYLKKFKVYKLKIDQSFVRDIDTDQEDKAIVAAIINMSSSLGLQTIAEGVETAEQLAFLKEQGCDEAQGYYFSKPLPADLFEIRFFQGNITTARP
ncbi:MAG: EAL domain-containing protein [Gallionellaceae bacterium]|jgi:diguanylate cyclase (GGDEF)-like protein/PAS domain S-box-containing protein